MASVDRFLEPLRTSGATAVELVEGKTVHVEVGGQWRPITRDPLGPGILQRLLGDVAPALAAAEIAEGRPTRFQYAAPIGAVDVHFKTDNGHCRAMIRPTGVAAPDPADRAEMEALLGRLVEVAGSDLHLRSGEPPVLRVDGDLRRDHETPLSADHVGRLLRSIMSPANATEFASQHDVDWAHEIEGKGRFRCNAGLDRRGPFGVFRLIPDEIRSVDDLGVAQSVQAFAGLTQGLVLVTGPTGSGKSTTLAAIIDLVNRTRTEHIITIEDPIEFVHPGKQCLITQRQVGPHTNSFKQALRAALREDPDVVLVGELRDLETIAIALETAETGHLVFGTLHTTTAASTLDRMIDQFPADRQSQIRVMLSESLRGVVSQVLCRRIGGGRVAAREVLITIPAISNLIREGKTFQIPSIMQTNRRVGMATLNDALIELVDAGVVEPREAYLKAAEKPSFLQSLQAKGHDTSFAEPA